MGNPVVGNKPTGQGIELTSSVLPIIKEPGISFNITAPKEAFEGMTIPGFEFRYNKHQAEQSSREGAYSFQKPSRYEFFAEHTEKVTANPIFSFFNSIEDLKPDEIRMWALPNGQNPGAQLSYHTEFGKNIIGLREDQGHLKVNYVLSDSSVVKDMISDLTNGQLKINTVPLEYYRGKLSFSPGISFLNVDGPLSIEASMKSKFDVFDSLASGRPKYSNELGFRGLNNPMLFETFEKSENQPSLLTKITLFNDPMTNRKLVLMLGTSSLESLENRIPHNAVALQGSGEFFGFKTAGSGIYEQNFDKFGGLDSEMGAVEVNVSRNVKGYSINVGIGGFHYNPSEGQNNYGLGIQAELLRPTIQKRP